LTLILFNGIISSVKNVGGNICGPIPMPRKIEKFTVTRSPHVDKKSMEKFVKITYTRLVRILGVTPAIIEELSKIEIQAGVGVEISVTN
jgi:small subunit ribosomal protein S10